MLWEQLQRNRIAPWIYPLPLLNDTDQDMVSVRVDLQSFLHLLVIQLWVVSQPAVTKDFIVLPN